MAVSSRDGCLRSIFFRSRRSIVQFYGLFMSMFSSILVVEGALELTVRRISQPKASRFALEIATFPDRVSSQPSQPSQCALKVETNEVVTCYACALLSHSMVWYGTMWYGAL